MSGRLAINKLELCQVGPVWQHPMLEIKRSTQRVGWGVAAPGLRWTEDCMGLLLQPLPSRSYSLLPALYFHIICSTVHKSKSWTLMCNEISVSVVR